MDDTTREHLRKLLSQHGRDVCQEPQECKRLLKNYFKGQHGQEVNLLYNALEEQVAQQLLEADGGEPVPILMRRLTARLKSNRSITQEAAEWAVQSWASALDIVPSSESAGPPALPPVSFGQSARPDFAPSPAAAPNPASPGGSALPPTNGAATLANGAATLANAPTRNDAVTTAASPPPAPVSSAAPSPPGGVPGLDAQSFPLPPSLAAAPPAALSATPSVSQTPPHILPTGMTRGQTTDGGLEKQHAMSPDNRVLIWGALCVALTFGSLFAGRAYQQRQNSIRVDKSQIRLSTPQLTAQEKAQKEAQQEAQSQAMQAKDVIDRVVLRMQELKKQSDQQTLSSEEAASVKQGLRKQLDEALRLADTALANDSHNEKAWQERARAFYYLSNRQEANRALSHAMQEFPNNMELRILKSNLDAHK